MGGEKAQREKQHDGDATVETGFGRCRGWDGGRVLEKGFGTVPKAQRMRKLDVSTRC